MTELTRAELMILTPDSWQSLKEDMAQKRRVLGAVSDAGHIKVWLGEFGVEVDLTGTHRALTSTPSNIFGMN